MIKILVIYMSIPPPCCCFVTFQTNVEVLVSQWIIELYPIVIYTFQCLDLQINFHEFSDLNHLHHLNNTKVRKVTCFSPTVTTLDLHKNQIGDKGALRLSMADAIVTRARWIVCREVRFPLVRVCRSEVCVDLQYEMNVYLVDGSLSEWWQTSDSYVVDMQWNE